MNFQQRLKLLRSKIESGGDPKFLAKLLERFSEDERRQVASELPGWLKELQNTHPDLIWNHPSILSALRVTGVACITGPAAAAQWLARADLRMNRTFDRPGGRWKYAEHVVLAAQCRPEEWRADVGRRLARRLRVVDQTGWVGDEVLWWTTALLLRSANEEPPAEEAFAVGWVRWSDPTGDLAADPLLEAMLPRLFEVEAIGQVFTLFMNGESWQAALLRLVAEGRARREDLLDGSIRRFLRGGTLNDLRWYADLHDALAPTPTESTARLRDYLRLLPTAPTQIVELALSEVRRADKAGHLAEPAFTEAAEALLFRPEKKLVQATLTWLDEAARADGARVDAAVVALGVVFGHGVVALQERAVRIAVKHGPKVGDEARLAVREAATVLPADLRERVGAVFGEVDAPEATSLPALAPPPPTAAFPAPIASAAELAEELAAVGRGEPDWLPTERLLAGMIDFAHRDPEGAREAMRPIFEGDRGGWYRSADFSYEIPGRFAPIVMARAFLHPSTRPRSHSHGMVRALTQGAREIARLIGQPPHQPPEQRTHKIAGLVGRPSHQPVRPLLEQRARELAGLIGHTPLLLSTPTAANGRLDAGELISRLERLEAGGHQPGPIDLTVALLRVAPDGDRGRAARLTSQAGRTVASWLAMGGMPDLVVEPVVLPVGYRPDGEPGKTVMATVSPMDDASLAELPNTEVAAELAVVCNYPAAKSGWRQDREGHFGLNAYYEPLVGWGQFLPTHPELAAVHLLPQLALSLDYWNDQGTSLLALAETEGPTGLATGLALVYGMSTKLVKERAGAVDAVIQMAARGRLPAAELGTAIGLLVENRVIKLGRVVTALGEAADSGAHAEVWTAVELSLPAVLAANADKTVAGLADLLALGSRTAEANGARARIQALEDLTARKGSSRTLKEATRLHKYLTRI